MTLASTFDAITAEQLWAAGRLKWQRPGIIGAWIAEMDFGLAGPVAELLRSAADGGWTGYPTARDVAELRRACAGYQARAYGWHVDPEWVQPITDGLTALEIAIEHFSRPGSDVIVPTPAYMPFLTRPGLLGRRVVQIPMLAGKRWSFDIDRIDRAFAAGASLLVLTNPHNPIGQVHTRTDLEPLVEVVERYGGRVLADEIHGPITFPGHPHTPYASLSPVAAGHSATLVSAAKAWNIPGLKCAQLILTSPDDRDAWPRIGPRHEPATLGVLANTVAYDEGGPWLSEVLDYLDANRQLLDGAPGRRVPLEGTYLSWLQFLGLDEPAAAWLERLGIQATPGRDCGAQSDEWVRFNIAMPAPILRRALSLIGEALQG